MAHVRGGRKRARRSYLTKKTFLGTTTLQMRWEIVNLYAYEGVPQVYVPSHEIWGGR